MVVTLKGLFIGKYLSLLANSKYLFEYLTILFLRIKEITRHSFDKYTCMYAYIYTYIYVYTHTEISIYTHVALIPAV